MITLKTSGLPRLPIYVLFVVEGLVLFSSPYVGWWLKSGGVVEDPYSVLPGVAVFVPLVLLGLTSMGLYHFHQRAWFHEVFGRLVAGLFFGSLTFVLLGLAIPSLQVGLDVGAIALLYSLTLLLMIRFLFRKIIDKNVFRRKTLVYGTGQNAAAISDLRRLADRRGFEIVGNVPALGDTTEGQHAHVLDEERTLLEIARETQADEIVVAMDDRRGKLPEWELLDCKLRGIDVIDLITFLERETGKIRVDLVNSGWLIFSPGFRISWRRRVLKRLSDLLIGTLILLLTWPLFVIIALAIKLEDGLRAPVMYRQRRSGLRGKLFSVFKFRSMQVDAEKAGERKWANVDDERTTRVGRVIRRFRFDELPQLINVLRGQMSLVGPRPERPEFVDKLAETIPFYVERHSVKPGVTGWAQVRYSYAASEEDATEKLQYDLYYVKNHSLLLDLAIILQTVEVILWSKGAR